MNSSNYIYTNNPDGTLRQALAKHSLSISDLPCGIYVLKVEREGKIVKS